MDVPPPTTKLRDTVPLNQTSTLSLVALVILRYAMPFTLTGGIVGIRATVAAAEASVGTTLAGGVGVVVRAALGVLVTGTNWVTNTWRVTSTVCGTCTILVTSTCTVLTTVTTTGVWAGWVGALHPHSNRAEKTNDRINPHRFSD